MIHDLFDYAEAQKARDAGIARLHENLIADSWIAQAREFALLYAAKHGEVSADDVLKFCPRPSDVHKNSVGAIFRSKQLRLVGFKQSSKVSSHARRIGIYQVVL